MPVPERAGRSQQNVCVEKVWSFFVLGLGRHVWQARLSLYDSFFSFEKPVSTILDHGRLDCTPGCCRFLDHSPWVRRDNPCHSFIELSNPRALCVALICPPWFSAVLVWGHFTISFLLDG